MMQYKFLSAALCASLFIVCLTFECATAQTIISSVESSPPTVQSHAAPVWEGYSTGNETNWRPYVLYPGQPGNPVSNPPSTWSHESQPLSFHGTTPGSAQEIIISEEPVDGVIIGTYENGQLIYTPGFSGTSNAPLNEQVFESAPPQLGEVILDSSEIDSEQIVDPGQIEIVDGDSTNDSVEEMNDDAEALNQARIVEAELQSKVELLTARNASLEASLEESAKRSQVLAAELAESKSKQASIQKKSSNQVNELATAFDQSKAQVKDLTQSLAEKEKLMQELMNERSAKEAKNNQTQKKTIAKLKKENQQIRSRMAKASKLVEQMEKQLAELKGDHVAQMKKLEADSQKRAKSLRDSLKMLAETKTKLADKTRQHAELKEQFIKAFEADKKSKEEAKSKQKKSSKNEWVEKKKKDSKKGKSSAKQDSDVKKHQHESDKKLDPKEKRIKAKEAELREEMKKKMADARERITAVGQKKIDALLKKGKKKDCEEVEEIKEQVSKSLRVSDRKIRARYERKILKLK